MAGWRGPMSHVPTSWSLEIRLRCLTSRGLGVFFMNQPYSNQPVAIVLFQGVQLVGFFIQLHSDRASGCKVW
jgi:hypothetical protein